MDIKYKNNKFQFIYRTSAIIYNSDKSFDDIFTGFCKESNHSNKLLNIIFYVCGNIFLQKS